MTPAEISALSGRALDAEVHRALGKRCRFVDDRDDDGQPDLGVFCGGRTWLNQDWLCEESNRAVPHYSAPDGPLSPMLAWLREKGWRVDLIDCGGEWVAKPRRQVGPRWRRKGEATGATINEALARCVLSVAGLAGKEGA